LGLRRYSDNVDGDCLQNAGGGIYKSRKGQHRTGFLISSSSPTRNDLSEILGFIECQFGLGLLAVTEMLKTWRNAGRL
jgi:hypothetical protein